MADSRFVSESIEEMLVALASGVREAQEALNEIIPVDAYERPLPTYHIPYLDFQIGVEITTRSQGGGRPVLQIMRLPAMGGGQDSTTRSSLSGRLVALPPGEGLPLPIVRLDAEPVTEARMHPLVVQLSNTAGEVVPGTRVEVNIDAEASRRLSAASGVPPAALGSIPRAGTRLSEAVLTTEADGRARTVLTVDPTEDARAMIVVTARAGTATTSLSIPVGGGA